MGVVGQDMLSRADKSSIEIFTRSCWETGEREDENFWGRGGIIYTFGYPATAGFESINSARISGV